MMLEKRVAIITGVTGGLGPVVTRAFLQQGARVMAGYRSSASFAALRDELGPEAQRLTGLATEAGNEASVQALAAQTVAQFGAIDILVNLVGGYAGGVRVADLPVAEWDRVLELNLKTTFLMCKAVLPYMVPRGYGRIISFASRSALEVGAGAAAYSVSKAGVITLTQALAREYQRHKITANVIAPGTIDTPANRREMPGADFSKWVAPATLARLVVLLASDAAGDLSGAVIPVHGRG